MESPIKCPLDEDRLKIIDEMLANRPNYKIEQINGQRLYRVENDEQMAEPMRGSEVFIGRLPRDCYEDELVPIFEEIGPIRRLRLMMDFSGTNRGYAFVVYRDPETARMASERLDGFQIRPNHYIGVMVSWDKRRLFIGGIPKNKKKKEVMNEMRKVTEGVRDVILYMSVYNHKNRGFCFVEYETHRDAAMARRRMGDGFLLWGKYEVRVDWAEPEPEVTEEEMSKVTIIHIRNLPLTVSEVDLKDIFSFDGLRIERVKKIRDFAFIHYTTRTETETALSIANSIDFLSKNPSLSRIQVSYARPPKAKPLRKRAVSLESTQSEISICGSSPSSRMLYPMNMISSPTQTNLSNQFRYYQNLCAPKPIHSQQNLISSPLKYENPLIEDKNSVNFFVVWVPVVWLPQNQNKDQFLDDKLFR